MPGKVRSDAAEQVLAVAQPEPEGLACHKNNVGSSDLWVMCPQEDDSLLGGAFSSHSGSSICGFSITIIMVIRTAKIAYHPQQTHRDPPYKRKKLTCNVIHCLPHYPQNPYTLNPTAADL